MFEPSSRKLVILFALFLRSSNRGTLEWAAIGFCAGLYLFFHGFQLLRRRRLILDTPFSKIRSASMGMVEVSGLAVGPYTLTAPITARPCYYYRTLVWEWRHKGKNSKWVKIVGECMHVPFFLDDNSGKVLIDPREAELELHCDFQQEFCDSFFTTKEPAPPNVHDFLLRHGIITNNKIKVEEFCIKPKNALFILGTLGDNPGVEVTSQAVRDKVDVSSTHSITLSLTSSTWLSPKTSRSDVIHLSPKPLVALSSIEMSQQQRVAAALQKAGIASPAAWSATSVATADPAAGDFESNPAVALMKGTNEKTFLISWRSRQDVARALGWKCALMIWGGPALALVSLYCLISLLT